MREESSKAKFGIRKIKNGDEVSDCDKCVTLSMCEDFKQEITKIVLDGFQELGKMIEKLKKSSHYMVVMIAEGITLFGVLIMTSLWLAMRVIMSKPLRVKKTTNHSLLKSFLYA